MARKRLSSIAASGGAIRRAASIDGTRNSIAAKYQIDGTAQASAADDKRQAGDAACVAIEMKSLPARRTFRKAY